MALRPPTDFSPPAAPSRSPSERELRELWDRHEAARRERERAEEWRNALEQARRDAGGQVRPALPAADLPAYLRESCALGPDALEALRPVPRDGRVVAAGIDTWSPCWYAEPGSPLAQAMRALATHRTRIAWLVPEPVDGYRVGWFAEPGLVFAEGHPAGEGLCAAAELMPARHRLHRAIEDLGIPVASGDDGGLRRLDVAADLWTDSPVEGLAFLECVSAASPGAVDPSREGRSREVRRRQDPEPQALTGELQLAGTGDGDRQDRAARVGAGARGASELRLEVRAAGVKLRRLAADGSVKLALTVRFTPQGGVARAARRGIVVTAAD